MYNNHQKTPNPLKNLVIYATQKQHKKRQSTPSVSIATGTNTKPGSSAVSVVGKDRLDSL
jgi:hypothetical protein